jgi:mannose-6-phosphate isomerase-like protein (cupin superfamily)
MSLNPHEEMLIIGGNLAKSAARMPWGTEVLIAATSKIGVKLITLKPGCALSRQLHLQKDEVYYVLRGGGEVELGRVGQVKHHLSSGDPLSIAAGTIHRLRAGPKGITILECSTAPINDIIRIEDNYGRLCNPDFDVDLYKKQMATEIVSGLQHIT